MHRNHDSHVAVTFLTFTSRPTKRINSRGAEGRWGKPAPQRPVDPKYDSAVFGEAICTIYSNLNKHSSDR